MIDLEPIRERWITERPMYEALGGHIVTILSSDLKHRGLLCSITARSKDIASLLKKALRGSYREPYEEIHDKEGIRVIPVFANDVPVVEEVVRARFEIKKHENKTLGLDYHELGYLGIHCDVALRDPDVRHADWKGLIAEIQIQTTAQNCWADVSHRLLYKPAQDAPVAVKRRIYRLMALVELFDETVQDARKVIEMQPGVPEAAALAQLERHFYRFVGRPYDRNLSLTVIAGLSGVYQGDEWRGFGELMDVFVGNNTAKLVELFDGYRDDDRANPLLFQPEALVVFERLEREPFRLREAWAASFPLPLLESLAAMWGRPV